MEEGLDSGNATMIMEWSPIIGKSIGFRSFTIARFTDWKDNLPMECLNRTRIMDL
jgi:hypothetical protein